MAHTIHYHVIFFEIPVLRDILLHAVATSCIFTGVHMCASRFGDRLLMVNGQDFCNISRKKAAEVLRSCDQLSVSMEISRTISKLKPQAMVSNRNNVLEQESNFLCVTGGTHTWEEVVWIPV